MNGYETEEVRERHVAALVIELEQAEAAGDGERAAAARRSLADFAQEAKTPTQRAERRPAPRRKRGG